MLPIRIQYLTFVLAAAKVAGGEVGRAVCGRAVDVDSLRGVGVLGQYWG